MSGMCFTDSSAWIALAFSRDKDHTKATYCFEALRLSKALFVTTQFVFAETMIFLRRHTSVQTAIEQGELLLQSPQIWIADVGIEIHSAAWKVFKRYQDWKDLSYTDCVSFTLMRDMGIKRAFTFDSDFSKYGFTQLPEN